MIGSIKAIKAARTAALEEVEAPSLGHAPTVQVSSEETMLRFLAQRFYLSYDMVLEARSIFERYCILDRAVEPPLGDGVGEVEEGGVPEATTTPPCAAPESVYRIGITGLRAFFSDLGVAQSDIEIADLVERLSGRIREFDVDACDTSMLSKPTLKRKINKQSSSEEQKISPKRKIASFGIGSLEEERGVANHNTVGSEHPLATPQSDVSPELKSGGLHALTVVSPPGLSFYHFLFLLQEDFYDGAEVQKVRQQQEKEAAEVFREMDVDHNGILTESDIRQVLARLLTEETTFQDDETILRLASLHPIELQAALEEFDIDSDGNVTLSDFLSVLRS
ncbi:unnamed protein product [Phytomonas sp. EM1]|nr:unnamed protein product [Phytomonas sp. EM1]|eukprot:CCW65359.1 unnamed protein product [Phytomonas sp. isolate EM1]